MCSLPPITARYAQDQIRKLPLVDSIRCAGRLRAGKATQDPSRMPQDRLSHRRLCNFSSSGLFQFKHIRQAFRIANKNLLRHPGFVEPAAKPRNALCLNRRICKKLFELNPYQRSLITAQEIDKSLGISKIFWKIESFAGHDSTSKGMPSCALRNFLCDLPCSWGSRSIQMNL